MRELIQPTLQLNRIEDTPASTKWIYFGDIPICQAISPQIAGIVTFGDLCLNHQQKVFELHALSYVRMKAMLQLLLEILSEAGLLLLLSNPCHEWSLVDTFSKSPGISLEGRKKGEVDRKEVKPSRRTQRMKILQKFPISCHMCGKFEKESTLLLCGRCKRVRYCSVECQREEWKVHKTSCTPAEKQ